MSKSVVDTMQFEDGQTNLTEAQIQQIANEAIHENEHPKEDDWKNPAEEELAKQEEELKEKEQAEKEKPQEESKEAQKVDDDVKQKEADAEKVKEDSKVDDAKAKEQELKEKEKQKSDKPFAIEDRQKAIEELALKESLTLEEAEEQITKDEAIINKYKNNPVELARAMRQIQSLADKTKAELEATRKAADNPPAVVTNNVRDYVEAQLSPIKDKIVEAYKKEYPELVEGQSDQYIYGLIKKDAIDRTLKVLDETKSKLTSAAKEKRANLILNLSEQDKTFLPDIKAIIDRTADRQLLDKNWDLKDVIYWAKGKQFEKAVKEAEDRGFKRGQENPKIIGEKLPGSKTPVINSGEKKSGLNAEQKQRALEMFDSLPSMSDEDKFEAYRDTYPEEFTK